MAARYPLAALSAAVITFSLFYGMQALIARRSVGLEDARPTWQLEFVRLKRDENVNKKERVKPKKLDRPEPPPPADAVVDNPQSDVNIDVPAFNAPLAMGDGSGFGADSDVVPMVRVNPQYPQRAAARGVEGWVHLIFTVTPQGTTDNIRVVEADPGGYFESAAKSAVKRYRYKPKVEGGQPVSREGVEVVLQFALEK